MKKLVLLSLLVSVLAVSGSSFAEVKKDADLEKNFNFHTSGVKVTEDSYNLLIIETTPESSKKTAEVSPVVNKTKHNCVSNRTMTQCF